MHGDDFSLLPLPGIVIMTIGFLECFDAYIAKVSKDLLFNLQTSLFRFDILRFSSNGSPILHLLNHAHCRGA